MPDNAVLVACNLGFISAYLSCLRSCMWDTVCSCESQYFGPLASGFLLHAFLGIIA
jgi:hypothetical protein